MPASEKITRRDAGDRYFYRRPLRFRELWPAIGAGIGAGLIAFYITRLMLQRTPLEIDRRRRVRHLRVETSGEA